MLAGNEVTMCETRQESLLFLFSKTDSIVNWRRLVNPSSELRNLIFRPSTLAPVPKTRNLKPLAPASLNSKGQSSQSKT